LCVLMEAPQSAPRSTLSACHASTTLQQVTLAPCTKQGSLPVMSGWHLNVQCQCYKNHTLRQTMQQDS